MTHGLLLPNLVSRALASWRRELVDTSRRNNLLFFKAHAKSTLPLGIATSPSIAALLAGERVALGDLTGRELLDEARGIVRTLTKKADENEEERGLQTLFVALGFATWTSTDGGSAPNAPVLLVPVTVERGGREGAQAWLTAKDEPDANAALLHLVTSDHGVRVDSDALLAAEDGALSLDAVFARLTTAATAGPGLRIEPRAVLGNFSFQKLAMYRDLEQLESAAVNHALVSALCGVPEALAAMASPTMPSDAELVPRAPEAEWGILDADSSQQAVVALAAKGASLVVQGPPGTGKSQTIANTIATLVAEGKRVLFVAEKRAALQVVHDRLRNAGLGQLALDLHGAEVSRKQVYAQVAAVLDGIGRTAPAAMDGVHQTFVRSRDALEAHARRLHQPRGPANESWRDVASRLLTRRPPVTTRLRGPLLATMTPEVRAQARALVEEAAQSPELFLRSTPSPWHDTSVSSPAEAQQIVDAAQALQLASERLEATVPAFVQASGIRPPSTVRALSEAVALAGSVETSLVAYAPTLYASNWEERAFAIQQAARGLFSLVIAFLFSGLFRRARREALALRSKPADVRTLATELAEVVRQQAAWKQLGGQQPCTTAATFAPVREALDAYRTAFGALAPFVSVSEDVSWRETAQRVKPLVDRAREGTTVGRLRQVETALRGKGLGPFVDELRAKRPEPAAWINWLETLWDESSLEAAAIESPELVNYGRALHDRDAAQFVSADRQRVALASQRVRRAHAERAVAAMNAQPSQAALVRGEASKKSRHRPLRQLLAEAPDVFLALCPCVMASPLTVSQLLPGERPLFDVCIIDEASQIQPEDAVNALLRAKSAIVAGDRHQLPPTNFFADGGDDEESPTGGHESILDALSAVVPQRMLEWHYRSRDESLIAFSNAEIYDGRLVTFPGPTLEGALRHVLVEGRPTAGDVESSSAEVEAVVREVLAHAEARPDESLGVITMGLKHMQRVEAALEAARRTRPDLDAFFGAERRERFFVKNLERVQGDERDAIILTIGYGKDADGRLPFRFGPLLTEGGERRLNVAVTRSRRRMTVVSSFDDRDMDLSRSKARGVALLRSFLAYARSGGRRLAAERATTVPLNGFEEDIRSALAAKGIACVPQLGVGRFRIDLAAVHPQQSGRFVLAIECDGASYHSGATARDRDRLRQQQLEALGWRFHRIWSTDWFERRSEELARAVAAFEAACLEEVEPALLPVTTSVLEVAKSAPDRAQRKATCPVGPRDGGIDAYSDDELRRLVAWLRSDGLLRTDDALVEEASEALGFQRVGAKIRRRLVAAVRGERPRLA